MVIGWLMTNLLKSCVFFMFVGLELTITGGAKCQWTETYSTGNGSVTIFYTGREKYFEITNNLLTEKQQSMITQNKGKTQDR